MSNMNAEPGCGCRAVVEARAADFDKVAADLPPGSSLALEHGAFAATLRRLATRLPAPSPAPAEQWGGVADGAMPVAHPCDDCKADRDRLRAALAAAEGERDAYRDKVREWREMWLAHMGGQWGRELWLAAWMVASDHYVDFGLHPRIEAAESDRDAARAELERVTAERDAARGELTRLSHDRDGVCERFARLRLGVACAIRAETAAVRDCALVYDSRQTHRLIDLAARIEDGEVPNAHDFGLQGGAA